MWPSPQKGILSGSVLPKIGILPGNVRAQTYKVRTFLSR